MQYYGVSPAYFISSFTDRFTPDDVAGTLAEINELGYDSVELEVYHPDSLDTWEHGGLLRVVEQAERVGLSYSHFVAHFLLHAFGDPAALSSPWGIAETKRLVRMLDRAEACDTVVVPLPPFRLGTSSVTPGDDAPAHEIPHYRVLWDALVRKVAAITDIVGSSARRLAIEVLPGALISGSDGFLRLREDVVEAVDGDAASGEGLGYNFDTGHAWAQGEPTWLIPGKLGSAVYGTHLCDNDGAHNASLRPGAGTVPWEATVGALEEAEYAGPIDIEVNCEPGCVRQEYARALEYITALHTSAREVPS
jgi:sugar phosphate isomerase/epimerase